MTAPVAADVAPSRPSRQTGPVAETIGTLLRAVALAAAVLLLLWLLWSVLLLVFFAVLLGATLRGAADWLAVRTGASATWLLALVTLLLAALAVGLGFLIGPPLAQQSADLASSLASEANALQHHYGDTEWGRRILGDLRSGSPGAGTFAAPAFRLLGGTLDLAATLILLVITALYLAISPELYIVGLLRLVPIHRRPRARAVMRETGRTLRRWLLGQVVDMIAIGMLTGLGLALLGVPVPLALGALAGLLTFIPYFGAVLAGVPAVLVALSVSPHLALLTLGVFLLVHLVEGYVVSPLIQRRMVELPPAVTVTAMTVAGTLFGPLGIVLGTPLAAAGLVLVRELYVADLLGDDEVRAGA